MIFRNQAYRNTFRTLNRKIVGFKFDNFQFLSPRSILTATASTTSSNDGTERILIPPKSFKPYPFEYHEELVITIDELSNNGVGIGRVDLSTRPMNMLPPIEFKEKKSRNRLKSNTEDDDNEDVEVNTRGFVVMVPLVVPGERVKVRIYRNFKNYSEADLLEIIERRNDIRVEPQCKYFSSCGGCQYQHINVEAQREWKQQQVSELMQRIGGLDITNNDNGDNKTLKVNSVVGTEHHFHYRSKLTPHYDRPRGMAQVDGTRIGFQRRGTRQLVDVEKCIIGTDAINDAYSQARSELKMKWLNGNIPKKGATMLFRDCEEGVATDNNAFISQKVCDKLFRFRASEFFQNNPFVLPLMVEHVLDLAQGDGCTQLVDTYCGSGLFAICGAEHFAHVSGVEVSHFAVKAAKDNAELNNIGNAEFMHSSAEAIFAALDRSTFQADTTTVVIDPPRKGCDQLFLDQLFEFNPKKLVYVSCDPATQARDTALIVAAGYQVTSCTPFDLFPQTRHIENVMSFIRD